MTLELEQKLKATRDIIRETRHKLHQFSGGQPILPRGEARLHVEDNSVADVLRAARVELESLDEELVDLTAELMETLESQRTMWHDLQNVLNSTDVAIILLDTSLNIRFFTPATKSLFKIAATDIGWPLTDLTYLTIDTSLIDDISAVLLKSAPIEKEVQARNGAWFMRRILPYRTEDSGVRGIVITYDETTERRHAADALEAAKRRAQLANAAKSRFLAAASHDLRQPLQTLVLVQGLLAKSVEGERAEKLVSRLDDTLTAMSGMLNALLDINQIEAGSVEPDWVYFPVNDLLESVRGEFAYQAQAQQLLLKVVPCNLKISSDPRLLEQMVRNLISNALKYTKRGKVLVGCRRHADLVSIQVWDTGIGMPDTELQAIFEEYHQIDNVARERSRGLGLGLSIVQRLAMLLDHPVHVRSRAGKGSMFAIDIPFRRDQVAVRTLEPASPAARPQPSGKSRTGTIIVIEDDPEVRELVEILLKEDGHDIQTVPDGLSALELLSNTRFAPDLILADYNLPNGMDGLQVTQKIRDILRRQIPVVILTGDISTRSLIDITRQNGVRLNKPVKMHELTNAIQRLLSPIISSAPSPSPRKADGPTVYLIDDDPAIRASIADVLEDDGRVVECFESAEAFLASYRADQECCLLVDAGLPGISGIELLQRLKDNGDHMPAILITGNSDVHMAVAAMKAGATDFVEKPIGRDELLLIIGRTLELARDQGKRDNLKETAASSIAGLTTRQRQVMDMVLAGYPSKNIAVDLGISQRTVENHRAAVMRKTGSRSIPALVRLTLAGIR